MGKIKIFENKEFGSVRTVEQDNQVWFVAKDVCDCLGLSNSRMAVERLDDDEKADVSLTDTSSNGVVQNRNYQIVNEMGLYNLILRSDKPEAKQFKRWVTHEVLPSIRKHGVYAVDEILNNPDVLIKSLEALKKERAEKALLQKEVEEMKPKALFADAVSASSTSILVGDLAKLLKQNGFEVGQNRLFEILRQEGYLIKSGSSRNLPTQMAMEKGLFVVKERTIVNPDESIRIILTTKVTGKGQAYFINKFLKRVA